MFSSSYFNFRPLVYIVIQNVISPMVPFTNVFSGQGHIQNKKQEQPNAVGVQKNL